MKKLTKLSFLVVLLPLIFTCKNREVKETDRMERWLDARFGLFLHWGLYSIPAGEWNGKLTIPCLSNKIINAYALMI